MEVRQFIGNQRGVPALHCVHVGGWHLGKISAGIQTGQLWHHTLSPVTSLTGNKGERDKYIGKPVVTDI